jgi:hypothetical protein
LIEAGEGQPRPRGHEEAIHELGVTVEREVARLELDRDGVLTATQRRWRQQDVLASNRRIDSTGVSRDPAHGGAGEIERQRTTRVLEPEPQGRGAGHRLSRIGGDLEMQLVAQVADARRTLLGERQRNACGWHRRNGCGRGLHAGHVGRVAAGCRRARRQYSRERENRRPMHGRHDIRRCGGP